MKYRPEIDGLRALAVIPIILFHAGIQSFSGGFVGVDIFFVISGYLITSIILSDMDKGSFSLLNFYERRARRIFPALFFMIFCCIPLAWIWFVPRDLLNFAESLIAVATFTSNFFFLDEIGYFERAAELKPFLHTWSLAVEEQHYIIFPILLMTIWRFGKSWIIKFFIGLFLASLSLAHIGSFYKPEDVFYLLPTRAWELIVGIFAALYFNRIPAGILSRFQQEFCGIAGLFLIFCAIFAFDESIPFPGLYALVPTIGALLIIVSTDARTVANRLLSLKPMVVIGLLSYSAYLWHQPLLAFVKYQSFGELKNMQIAGICIATFILAYFSWRYVERPFRNKRVTSSKFIFSASATAATLLVMFGIIGMLADGKFNRFEGPLKLAIDTKLYSPFRDCTTKGSNYRKPNNACIYYGKHPTWAILGDSHAVEIGYALARALKPRNTGIRHLAFTLCSPTYGQPKNTSDCANWTKEAVQYIVNSPNLHNVVVSYRIVGAINSYDRLKQSNTPAKLILEQKIKVWNAYIRILNTLRKSGKKVFVILQAPEAPGDPQRMLRFMRHKADPSLTGVTREGWFKQSSFVRERLGHIPDGVIVIDPSEKFCDKMTCHLILDGKLLYYDNHHMSLAGADIVVEEILGSDH